MRTIEIFKLWGSILINTDEAMKSISSIAKNFEETGAKVGKIGKDLTKKVTAPIMAIGGAAVKMSMNMEDAMAKVSTLADTSQVSLDELKKGVRAISDETGIASVEVANSVYDALSAGVETADVLEYVGANAMLAKAGFTDMGNAIDATSTILNAYGDSAFDVTKIGDILVKTQDEGKISVDELGKNIGRVIPIAASLGVNVDQLGASYSILTAKGQNASIATTNLNSMLGELGKTGSKSDEALREMTGKSFKELIESGASVGDVLGLLDEYAQDAGLSLSDMFGSTTAGSAALTLMSDGVDEFNNKVDIMNNSTGTMEENIEKLETTGEKMRKTFNRIKNAMEGLGDVIVPVFEPMVDWTNKATEKLSNLDENTLRIIVSIAAMAAAIGPLIMVGGKLTAGIGKVIGLASKVGAILSPQGLILIGIGLLIAWIVHLWQTNEEFRDRIAEIWEQVQDIFSSTFEIIQGIIGVFVVWATEFWNIFGENIIGITDTAWKFITSVISVALDLIKSIISIFIGIVTGDWGEFAEGLKSLWKAAWSAIKAILEIAKLLIEDIFYIFIKTISETWQNFTELLKNIWDAAWGIIRNVTDVILNAIKNIIDIFISAVTGAWTAFTDLLKNIWQNMWYGIKRIVEGAWELLSSAFAMLWDSIENWFIELAKAAMTWGIDMVKGLWEGISSMVDWIGEKVSGFAAGVANSFKKFFGIASPSTLMAEYGKNIEEGLAEGILENEGIPMSAIRIVGSKLTDAAKNTVSSVNKILASAKTKTSRSGGGGGGSSRSKSSSREREKYQRENRKYERENDSEIDRISREHDVDTGVAREMSKTNDREGKKIYHTGGWVGRPLFNMDSLLNNVQAWLKNDELAAILQDGEFVLSRDMLGQIKKASDSIGAASKSGGNGGKGGDIIQHIKIVSPEPLSPSETARQVKNASRELAMEV